MGRERTSQRSILLWAIQAVNSFNLVTLVRHGLLIDIESALKYPSAYSLNRKFVAQMIKTLRISKVRYDLERCNTAFHTLP